MGVFVEQILWETRGHCQFCFPTSQQNWPCHHWGPVATSRGEGLALSRTELSWKAKMGCWDVHFRWLTGFSKEAKT